MKCSLLLLILRGVIAIKLPGSDCPDVPATHRKNCFLFQLMMYSIPFTVDKPTHFFKSMNKIAIAQDRYIIVFSPDEEAPFAPTLVDKFNPQFRIRSEVVSFDNKSFGLKSDIYEINKLVCLKPIFENVHFWCETPFFFIWSCVEGKEGAEHEEALLIMEQDIGKGRSQKEVISVARKFLPKDVLGLINFDDHFELNDRPANGFFACAHPPLKWAPFILIAVIILLVVVAASYWYFTKREEDQVVTLNT